MIKRVLSLILVFSMLLIYIPYKAYADEGSSGPGMEDHYNESGGTNQTESGVKFTWKSRQSGYRLVIVDQNFQEQSRVVNLVFSDPFKGGFYYGSGGKNFYTNSRANPTLSNSKDNWDFRTFDFLKENGIVDSNPNPPIYYDPIDSDIARHGGDQFKEWLLEGAEGIYVEAPTRSSVDIGRTSSRSFSGSSGIRKFLL